MGVLASVHTLERKESNDIVARVLRRARYYLTMGLKAETRILMRHHEPPGITRSCTGLRVT